MNLQALKIAVDPFAVFIVVGIVAVAREELHPRIDGRRRVFMASLIAAAVVTWLYGIGGPTKDVVLASIALAASAFGTMTAIDRAGWKSVADRLPAGPARDLLGVLAPDPPKATDAAPTGDEVEVHVDDAPAATATPAPKLSE